MPANKTAEEVIVKDTPKPLNKEVNYSENKNGYYGNNFTRNNAISPIKSHDNGVLSGNENSFARLTNQFNPDEYERVVKDGITIYKKKTEANI